MKVIISEDILHSDYLKWERANVPDDIKEILNK